MLNYLQRGKPRVTTALFYNVKSEFNTWYVNAANAKLSFKASSCADLNNQFKLQYTNKLFKSHQAQLALWATKQVLLRLSLWGLVTPYVKVMIIRGIGYRAFFIQNDLAVVNSTAASNLNLNTVYTQDSADYDDADEHSLNQIARTMYPYSRYLVIRAGHTKDLCQPMPFNVFVKTSKKDRKLVIFGLNKELVNHFAHQIYKYRKPSVYTGRGVRRKHLKPLRKAGKKDKQKGRVF